MYKTIKMALEFVIKSENTCAFRICHCQPEKSYLSRKTVRQASTSENLFKELALRLKKIINEKILKELANLLCMIL